VEPRQPQVSLAALVSCFPLASAWGDICPTGSSRPIRKASGLAQEGLLCRGSPRLLLADGVCCLASVTRASRGPHGMVSPKAESHLSPLLSRRMGARCARQGEMHRALPGGGPPDAPAPRDPARRSLPGPPRPAGRAGTGWRSSRRLVGPPGASPPRPPSAPFGTPLADLLGLGVPSQHVRLFFGAGSLGVRMGTCLQDWLSQLSLHGSLQN